MKQVILVELSTGDIVWLAWAAGIAAGSENGEAAESLNGILTRLQFINVGDEEDTTTESEDVSAWEDDGGSVIEMPERAPDPQFTPPPTYIPQNRQSDFGAGPPKTK